MNTPPKIQGSHFANPSLRGAIIAECPKCGIVCEDSSISISRMTVVSADKTETTENFKGTIMTKYVIEIFGEFLHRTCLVCKYSWEDPTVDTIGDLL